MDTAQLQIKTLNLRPTIGNMIHINLVIILQKKINDFSIK